MSFNFRLLIIAVICVSNYLFSPQIQAQSVWGVSASGTATWNTSGNWSSGGIPNAIDAIADFSQVNMAGNETVTVSSDTVGTLHLGDTGSTPANWILSGSTLTLATSSGTPTITVDAMAGSSTATISSTLHTTNGFIKAGPGPLILSANFNYVTNNMTIKQGFVNLTALDSSANNGLTNITLGDPSGGSATLALSYSTETFPTPITLATNAVGTLAISQTAGHSSFAGAITLNGNNLTVFNTSTSSSAGLVVSGGATGTGNVTFESDYGGGTNNYIQVSQNLVNITGTITMTGTSTAKNPIQITTTSGVGANVTNVNFNTTSESMTVNNLTVGSGGLVLNDNSTVSPTTATWLGSGTLTLNCNNTGSYSLGSMSGFTGNIVNSGTGSGSTTIAAITAPSTSVTEDSATSALILTASGNTYGGNTIISTGDLILTNNAVIANTPSVSIGAGGTLDVSGLNANAFALSSPTVLSASGTGTVLGTSAAAINGQAGGTIGLGSIPITLTYDGSDPALYIPQGTLSLSGNVFTVNSASPLAAGIYPIVQQNGGTISSVGSYPAVTGTAIGSDETGMILVIGTNIDLVVSVTSTQLSVSTLVPNSGSTNGGTVVTIYGANFVNGATVQFGSATPITATFVSSSMLTVTAPSQAAGAVTVTVENPDTSTATSSYTYTVPTTYYVDSVGGNDANSGTSIGSAWQSLTNVNSTTFQPDDKILFKAGGSWSGAMILNGSGVAGNPIVVDSYGTGSNPLINGNGYESAVLLQGVCYWELNDLEIINDGGTTMSGTTNYRAGILVTSDVSSVLPHLYFKNLYIHDIYPETGSAGYGIQVLSQGSPAVNNYYDDVEIENCQISLTGWDGCWIQHTGGGTSNPGYQYNTRITVLGNTFLNTGGSALEVTSGNGVLIESNICNGTGVMVDPRQYGRGSCCWPWSCTNVMIEYNELMHARGSADSCGAHIDFDNSDVTIQYNLSWDNEGGFCEILGGDLNSTYRYNVSINDGWRVQGVDGATAPGRVIQVSNFHGNGQATVGAQNCQIYNNTIYVEPSITNMFQIMVLSSNTYVENNIFYMAGGTIYTNAGFNTVFSNNLWYGNLPAGLPFDSGDVFANPLLANAGGTNATDYLLTPNSPALGAGTQIADNGGQDYWMNPLPEGNPSIGADQSVLIPSAIGSVTESGGNLIMVWQGGANQSCVLLTSTNPALPVADWTPVATNMFGANGMSTNTVPISLSQPQQFFLLDIP